MLFRLNVNDIIPLNNLFLFHFVFRFVGSVCSTTGKEDKIRSRLTFTFPKKKKKGKTNPNVSFSFLLSFHPVENSSVEETGRRAVRGTERNKKKKNGKKEKRKRERKKAIDWK